MRYLECKRVVILFLLFMSVMLVSCFPAAANETSEQDIDPSLTFTKTEQPTKTFVPTITESPLPTQTLTLTESPTIQPSSQPTDTNVPIVLPTKMRPKQSVASTATPTSSSTPTATFCPAPTPEPLWVDPVTSPTDQLTQVIKVYIGYGVEVTVTTESGTYTMTGDFSAYTNPALVEITLLPNTINHVQVTAKVMSGGNGCTYSYTLTTTRDKKGSPLDIAQGTAIP